VNDIIQNPGTAAGIFLCMSIIFGGRSTKGIGYVEVSVLGIFTILLTYNQWQG
jgi:hypothetical protein